MLRARQGGGLRTHIDFRFGMSSSDSDWQASYEQRVDFEFGSASFVTFSTNLNLVSTFSTNQAEKRN